MGGGGPDARPCHVAQCKPLQVAAAAVLQRTLHGQEGHVPKFQAYGYPERSGGRGLGAGLA